MARANDRGALVLGAAYFASFGALASSAPFLALVLGDAGFSTTATAQWLASLLVVRWLAIPAWTLLADRTRSIRRVLQVVSVGAALVFAPLLARVPPAAVLLSLAAFAVFRAPFGPLLDSSALIEASRSGAPFGRLRAWGTAGFLFAALGTGALVARRGSRGVLEATTVLLTLAALASLALPRAAPPPPGARAHGSIVEVVRRPRFLALLAIATLHQVGLAPYDALFPAHLTALAGASAAGVAVAVGAGCEFAFMIAGADLPRRWGGARLMRLACIGSAVRWGLMAMTNNPIALIAIQSLHALTFGAFYLAAIAIVDEEVPPSQRAMGQGVFSAWAFGIAAALGLSLAGVVERRSGFPTVFALGAGASLVAAIIPVGRARSSAPIAG